MPVPYLLSKNDARRIAANFANCCARLDVCQVALRRVATRQSDGARKVWPQPSSWLGPCGGTGHAMRRPTPATAFRLPGGHFWGIVRPCGKPLPVFFCVFVCPNRGFLIVIPPSPPRCRPLGAALAIQDIRSASRAHDERGGDVLSSADGPALAAAVPGLRGPQRSRP